MPRKQLTVRPHNLPKAHDIFVLQRSEQLDLADGCDRKPLLLVVHPNFLQSHFVLGASTCSQVNLAIRTLTNLVLWIKDVGALYVAGTPILLVCIRARRLDLHGGQPWWMSRRVGLMRWVLHDCYLCQFAPVMLCLPNPSRDGQAESDLDADPKPASTSTTAAKGESSVNCPGALTTVLYFVCTRSNPTNPPYAC